MLRNVKKTYVDNVQTNKHNGIEEGRGGKGYHINCNSIIDLMRTHYEPKIQRVSNWFWLMEVKTKLLNSYTNWQSKLIINKYALHIQIAPL